MQGNGQQVGVEIDVHKAPCSRLLQPLGGDAWRMDSLLPVIEYRAARLARVE